MGVSCLTKAVCLCSRLGNINQRLFKVWPKLNIEPSMKVLGVLHFSLLVVAIGFTYKNVYERFYTSKVNDSIKSINNNI